MNSKRPTGSPAILWSVYLLLLLSIAASILGFLIVPPEFLEREQEEDRRIRVFDAVQDALERISHQVLLMHIVEGRGTRGGSGSPGIVSELALGSRISVDEALNRAVSISPETPAGLKDRLREAMKDFLAAPASVEALDRVLLALEQFSRLTKRTREAEAEALRASRAAHPLRTGGLVILFAGILGMGAHAIASARENLRRLDSAVGENARRAADLERERNFAERLIDTAPAVVLLLDGEGRVVRVNRYFENLTGWALEDLKGRDWWDACIPERDRLSIRSAIRSALQLGTSKGGKVNPILTRAGGERQIEWHLQAGVDALGNASMLAIGIDISERWAAEEAVKKSEARLREAQRTARIGSWELELGGNRLEWSEEVFRIFEISQADFSPSYERFLGAIHPEDREKVDGAYRQSLLDHEPYRITHRLQMADGRVKYVEEQCRSEFAPDGAPLRSYGTIQDVTENVLARQALERSLREKDTLLREVHHRVKNNLQVISSLLYFQTKKAGDPKAVALFAEARQQLLSMILVHEKLYSSQSLSDIDFEDYLRSLARQVQSSVKAARAIKITLEAAPLRLPVDQALPCGMILVELLTNVFKYAYPASKPGDARVRLQVEAGRARLAVSDDGVGFPDGFDPERVDSFGWQLIRNLVEQLDGSWAVEPGPGARVAISFPLRPPADS